MLRYIEDLPDYVVGIHATGNVVKEDYEKVLEPRLNELLNGKARLIIYWFWRLMSKIFRWDHGGMILTWAKHFTKWNKIAIVTDQKAVEWVSDIFHLFIPGKSKGFPHSQLNDAIDWISERDDKEAQKVKVKTATELPLDNEVLSSGTINSSNKGQGPSGENL